MNNRPNVTFREEIPHPDAYSKLFDSTGWNSAYGASAKELYTAISNSWYSLCAYNDDELIGFGRVISDGILYAFICDMIIDPAYQNHGIGSAILHKLIRRCEGEGIRVLWLFAAADISGFYEKHGFKVRPPNAPGMQMNLNIAE